jgi:hypothetical protein
VGAKPAERGQGQHRRPVLRVGRDQQVPAVAGAQRQFRDPYDYIPPMLVSLVSQARQRSVHVLTSDREGLADHLEVPFAEILAVRRMEVAKPARNLSGLGRVSDKADLKRLHPAGYPSRSPDKHLGRSGNHGASDRADRLGSARKRGWPPGTLARVPVNRVLELSPRR